MIVATAVASMAAFVVAFWFFDVVRFATRVRETTQSAVAAMRDSTLDDMAREEAMQRASRRLMVDFAAILLRGGLALAVSLIPIGLVNWLGLAPADRVFQFLARRDVILIASVVMVGGFLVRSRVWPSN